MKFFDCHSHWATDRGYLFRTQAERDQQAKVWRTPAQVFGDDEQADYFRKNDVRTILDISWIKDLSIEEMRGYHDYIFDVQSRHRDVMFGQWLQFRPQMGKQAIDEFHRCLAKQAGYDGL